MRNALIALALAAGFACPAGAQDRADAPDRAGSSVRWRIGAGPQLVPSYPGADQVSIRPLVAVTRARGDDLFAFEAADESAGFPLLRADALSIGPAVNFEGKRRREDVGANLDEIGFTVEAGGFVQYQLSSALRVRVEARKGIGGHKGAVGNVGVDYVARQGDDWLFSVGPRVTLAGGRYQRAYFGVTPEVAARTGLATFRPNAGISAAGVTAGYVRQFGPRWGIYSYAKYDRLVDDAAASPVVRGFGSRDQWSGGIALTYSFTRRRD